MQRGKDDASGDGGAMPQEGGLRARFRKRKAATESHVEFGVAQANAYFNARRIKRGKKKATTQTRKQSADRGAGVKSAKAKRGQAGAGSGSGGEGPEEEEDEKRLVLPSRGEVLTALKQADDREAERRAANAKYTLPRFEQHFPLWRSQLLAGQNLLFYGVGSKLALLQKFADQCLGDGIVVQVHGYLPTVSIRYLTKFIHREVFQVHVQPSRTLMQQCQDIAKLALKDPRRILPRVYLVVHSIDGMAMRTPEIQTCLSWLGTASFLNIVASIDQINGTSIWKEEDSLRFLWISQSINTCIPYSDEIELRVTKQSKAADQSSSGIKFILQSLTPTDVATLQVVAQHQLAVVGKSQSSSSSSRRRTDVHADYQKVYEVCRKRLLHQTILAMKNSIKCLEEHGLVKLLRVRNAEKLEIPLSEHLIKAEILHMSEETSGQAKQE